MLVCPLFAYALTVSKLPVEISFDTPAQRADWKSLTSANNPNLKWVAGQDAEYAYKGTYMLYMSEDGGTTRSYTTVSGQTTECLVYCPIDALPAGQYTVDFHYRGPKYCDTTLCAAMLTSVPTLGMPDEWACRCLTNFWWQEAKFTFTASANTTYYLCFRFACYSDAQETNTGWAIDGIQIYPTDITSRCAQVPVGLKHTRSGNASVFSWEGNASEYQVEYYLSDATANNYHVTDNVTSTSYTLSGSGIQEGTYHFRVRAICELDTSAWTSLDYQLIYDKSRRCVDYIELPEDSLNYGFEDSLSRQTIHHYPHDFDERTNYKLRTFPTGYPASVRLGNWLSSAQADTIVYPITPTDGVLQLRYALVMQLANHTPATQPSFTIEFLDMAGNVLDSLCGSFNLTADWAKDNTWHTEQVGGMADEVLWRDWDLLGIDMHPYLNQPIRIRLAVKDCGDGNHFGYAYFTLSCSPGSIYGTHCGKQPESLWVDDGFYYRWYQKYDKDHVIRGTEYIYYPNYHPFDSATYCVDLINKIDTNCFFTLEASTLKFTTVPVASYAYDPSDCRNYVQFYNESYTIGEYYDENQQQWIEHYRREGVDSYYWDFGRGRTQHKWYPRQEFSKSGENVHAVLHTFVDDCESTFAMDFTVPRIGEKRTYDYAQFCEGDPFTYVYKGETLILFDAGEHVLERLISWEGCDSLFILSLSYYFRLEKVVTRDTLCMSVGSYDWRGRTLTHGGYYSDTVRSETYGCDSIIYILELTEQAALNVAVNYTPQEFCEGGGKVEVPYSIKAGGPVTYDLCFSETAKKLGLVDHLNQPVPTMDGKVEILLKEEMWPGKCDANLIFRNNKCDTALIPVSFTVHYTADSVITQRWNDFLSVRKTAYDYYGGFHDYQWYQDGQLLEGQTTSQLYLPDGKLQKNSVYRVEFTRDSDNVRVSTCDFSPDDQQPDTVTIITITPTLLSSQHKMPVHVHTSEACSVSVYYQSGRLVGQWAIKEGDNPLYLPDTKGLYLLRVAFDSGKTEIRKIIVE